MSEAMTVLAQARAGLRQVDKKLEDLVVVKPNGTVSMKSSAAPITAASLMDLKDVQVYHTTILEGVAAAEHAHADSTEFLIIITGTLQAGRRKYGSEQCVKIAKGQKHAPKAVGGPCSLIVVVIPPEPAFVPPKT